MSIATVKTKGQITLPTEVRKKLRLNVGDILLIDVKADKITLTPQSLIDRELAESIKEHRNGKSHGPFNGVGGMIAFLDKQTGKTKRNKK